MKNLLAAIVFLFPLTTLAQTGTAPKTRPLENFVPAGWKVIAQAEGDLNKDTIADIAMVIENTDAKNIIVNREGLGQDTLNLNPRHLLVLIKKDGQYYPEVINKKFIPSENDSLSPCLSDPFAADSENFTIKKGVLLVHFYHFSSCGSYYVTNNAFKFRMEKGGFNLIGYDEITFSRSTGDITETSVNLLTHKKSYTFGGNEFEAERNHQKTEWTTITPKQIALSELGNELELDLGF